jgi:disulfide oxidoreductase YuzD
MPSAWRVHVLEQRLREAGFNIGVSECDVYALEPADRTRVVDLIVAERAAFPMVLLDGAVVCHGGVDVDAVLRAIQEAPSDCCC